MENISLYESLYINIRDKLQLQALKKAIDAIVVDFWPVVKFVEAFAVHSN